jgi:hypothetical protein
MSLVEKDSGWNDLANRIAELSRGAHVKVGVQGSEASAAHAKSDITVVEAASIHEFGAKGIPERSFIRATMDAHETALQKRAAELGRGILLGALEEHQALALLGEDAVGKIKQRIVDRIPPPNAPATVAKKGSDVPLVDTGQLLGSITYSIEGAG